MSSTRHYNELDIELQDLLKLEHPPIAISFTNEPPVGVKKIDESVPSGCVFWIRAFTEQFYTSKNDHANCTIGSFTHGFLRPSQVSLDSCPDVKLMVQADYLALKDFTGVPRMESAPKFVSYAPLKSTSFEPDVVLMICNAEQSMLVTEATPFYETMGKPTCAAIPYAYNEEEVAISFGCVTNRVRTGLKSNELVVTIPMSKLEAFVANLKETAKANNEVRQEVAAMLKSR